jgi:hypothetical protein
LVALEFELRTSHMQRRHSHLSQTSSTEMYIHWRDMVGMDRREKQ